MFVLVDRIARTITPETEAAQRILFSSIGEIQDYIGALDHLRKRPLIEEKLLITYLKKPEGDWVRGEQIIHREVKFYLRDIPGMIRLEIVEVIEIEGI